MSELLNLTIYTPGQAPVTSREYQPTGLDYEYMAQAVELGRLACSQDTTPVGTVLVHTPTGKKWAAANTEFSEDDLMGHPEVAVYQEARPSLGRDLSDCHMYTLAEPCVGCSYWIDKGSMGRLYVGARRRDVEFFRDRGGLDMDQVFRKSRRSLIVISGLMIEQARELLTPANNVHHKVA